MLKSEVPSQKHFLLEGELGSGKTTFVKGFCKALGISEVNSPTFSIVNEYGEERRVYHFDLYRIKNAEELFELFTDV